MMNYQKINKDTKTLNLFSEIAKELAPPPKLTIDEWADTYRLLSSKSSSEPGGVQKGRHTKRNNACN